MFPLEGANTSTFTANSLPSPVFRLLGLVGVIIVVGHMGAEARVLRDRGGDKDKRPSISSRRSSSVSYCRISKRREHDHSTIGLITLREHRSDLVISTPGLMGDLPLTRSCSGLSQRRCGAKTPSSQGRTNDLGWDIRARVNQVASSRLVPAPRRGGRKRHSKIAQRVQLSGANDCKSRG